MNEGYLLAIDQGTTSSRALVFSLDGRIAGRGSCELTQNYPAPGWVEHAPEDICKTVGTAVTRGLADAGIRGSQVVAVGIANQRETAVLWDRETDEPLCRAIVWQDRRTSGRCAGLVRAGREPGIQSCTGLGDISAITVERPRELETTARGAAMLAGLGVGLYSSPSEAARMIGIEKSFMVRIGDDERASRRRLWQDAVRRARTSTDRHEAGARTSNEGLPEG